MRCLPSSNLFLAISQFDCITPKKMKLWKLPKIEGFLLKYGVPSLWPVIWVVKGGQHLPKHAWKGDYLLSKWKVNSGQSTLHTKHNLQKKIPFLSTPSTPPTRQKGRPLHSLHDTTAHWLHGNSIHKIGCHYFWPGRIAFPNNTLPIVCTTGRGLISILHQDSEPHCGFLIIVVEGTASTHICQIMN
jgi:hypothetical protein